MEEKTTKVVLKVAMFCYILSSIVESFLIRKDMLLIDIIEIWFGLMFSDYKRCFRLLYKLFSLQSYICFFKSTICILVLLLCLC